MDKNYNNNFKEFARSSQVSGSDSERRQELLKVTRKQMGSRHPEYNMDNKHDPFGIPAVHPRYRASYRSVYPNGYGGDEDKVPKSTLYVRILASLCLFFLFLFCDYQKISWNGIDASVIEQKISSRDSVQTVNQIVEELWKGL